MNKTAFAKKYRLPIQLLGITAIALVIIGATLTNLYLSYAGVVIALSLQIRIQIEVS